MKISEYCAKENGTSPTLKKGVSVRFTVPMLAHLELLSTQSGVARNTLIRQACYQFLQENGVEEPHQI